MIYFYSDSFATGDGLYFLSLLQTNNANNKQSKINLDATV